MDANDVNYKNSELDEIIEKLNKLDTPFRELIKKRMSSEYSKEQHIRNRRELMNCKKKKEVADRANQLNNNSLAAREFGISESSVRIYRKSNLDRNNIKKNNKKQVRSQRKLKFPDVESKVLIFIKNK